MYCNYCAKLSGDSLFCSEEHKEKFEYAKANNLTVPLRISDYPELTINTKAYDKIPSIIEKYMKNKEDLGLGSEKLQRYSSPKGKIKKNTPEGPLF